MSCYRRFAMCDVSKIVNLGERAYEKYKSHPNIRKITETFSKKNIFLSNWFLWILRLRRLFPRF